MIIGLQGKKRSGKDTVASFLPNTFTRYAFAGPLKQLLTNATGIDFFSDKAKETDQNVEIDMWVLCKYFGIYISWMDFRELDASCQLSFEGILHIYTSKRKLLQFVGTEIGRVRKGNNFWVDKLQATDNDLVVTDVRFKSEVDKVKQLGGIVITVERPGLESTDTHASEQLPSMGDYILTNDGTLEDLKNKVYNLLELINDRR